MPSIHSTVEKILFGSEGTPRAIGVQVSTSPSSPKYRVGATGEVILAAGVIASPQILFVSGVGPRVELEASGIRVVQELPAVGKHMLEVSNLISLKGLRTDLLVS